MYAHKLGLKALYYTRTRKTLIDECVNLFCLIVYRNENLGGNI